MYRIMVVGGKDGNIPWDKFTDKVEVIHHDSENTKRGNISFTPGRAPDIVLVIKKYLGHAAFQKFKKAAKTLNIPCVAAYGTFPALMKAAKERGHDLSRFLKNGKEEEGKEMAKSEVPAEVLSKKLGEWANSFPGNCWKSKVTGATVMVQRTKGGETGLVVKGKVLEFVLGLVQLKKLGGGVRGNLTPEEAKLVVKELDKTFELRKHGIKPPGPGTIIQNVAKVRGTLSPGRDKIMKGVCVAASAKPPDIKAVLCGIVPEEPPAQKSPESWESQVWPGGFRADDWVYHPKFNKWGTVMEDQEEADDPEFWKPVRREAHKEEVPFQIDLEVDGYQCRWVRPEDLLRDWPPEKPAAEPEPEPRKIEIHSKFEGDFKSELLNVLKEKTDELGLYMLENGRLATELRQAKEKIAELEKKLSRLLELAMK